MAELTEQQPKEKGSSLFRSTSIFSLMTLISRLFGFLRDMVVAHFFGATADVDAFYVAFKLPNFLRRMFAEGAFSQAFIPVLSEYREKMGEAETQSFMRYVFGNLALALFVVTVIGVISAPLWIRLFAPGFDVGGERFNLASSMLQVTFPYLLFISLTAFSASVLNTWGMFGVPAFAPVLLNISMILMAVKGAPYFHVPVKALAWGVFIAGVAQLVFVLSYMQRKQLLVLPKINWQHKGVKKVLKLMVPALFGASISQINLLVDTIFASFLPIGSVSWLYYANRLSLFPLGVFGVAIATVVLPNLSKEHARESKQGYVKTADWSLRFILFIGLPASVALIILSKPLLTTLLQYGKFSGADMVMTSKAVVAYAMGLVAFMLVKVLSSMFYAVQDIKTPVRVAAVMMLLNIILCLALIKPFQHMGLALATSITAWINAAALLVLLMKRNVFHFQPGWLKLLMQLMLGTGAMSALVLWLSPGETIWLAWSWMHRGSYTLLLVCMGIIMYFGTLWLVKFPYKDIYRRKT